MRSEWITKSWWGEGLQILDIDSNFSPFFLSSGTVTVWTAFTLGKALQFALATPPWTFLDIQKTVLPLFNVHDNIYAWQCWVFRMIGSGFIKSRVFRQPSPCKSKASLSAWENFGQWWFVQRTFWFSDKRRRLLYLLKVLLYIYINV